MSQIVHVWIACSGYKFTIQFAHKIVHTQDGMDIYMAKRLINDQKPDLRQTCLGCHRTYLGCHKTATQCQILGSNLSKPRPGMIFSDCNKKGPFSRTVLRPLLGPPLPPSRTLYKHKQIISAGLKQSLEQKHFCFRSFAFYVLHLYV